MRGPQGSFDVNGSTSFSWQGHCPKSRPAASMDRDHTGQRPRLDEKIHIESDHAHYRVTVNVGDALGYSDR